MTKSILLEHSFHICKRDLEQFHVRTLNFYVALSKQMLKRFLSSNPLHNLQLLEALGSSNVQQGNPKFLSHTLGIPLKVIPLAIKFPNIIQDSAHEDLTREWREQISCELPALSEAAEDAETFWYTVSRGKCGDVPKCHQTYAEPSVFASLICCCKEIFLFPPSYQY